jgi:acyl carrier protein
LSLPNGIQCWTSLSGSPGALADDRSKLHYTNMTTEDLKETLKHCPDGTLEALLDFRQTGNAESLLQFVKGAMIRHLDLDQIAALETATPETKLIDDVGIDSLTMTEIVIMIEECLGISIPNEDLLQLETFGALNDYLKEKGKGACDSATTAPV